MSVIVLLLSLFTWGQGLPSLAPPGLADPERVTFYRRLIESRGGRFEQSPVWVLGLRGLASDGRRSLQGPFSDTLVVIKSGEVLEVPGSTGVEPLGIRPGNAAMLTVAPDHLSRWERLLKADESFQYCLLDANLLPPADSRPTLPPATWNATQRFNYYQRLILSSRGRLQKGETLVLGLRGLSVDGSRHPSGDNQGGYDDTLVVLRRDKNGQPRVWELPGSTHAGDGSDPDAPAEGVAQIKPGQYRALPYGRHHGMACWFVRTPDGSERLPCWRDADSDGFISEAEKALAYSATQILFHNGLYADQASSIGCLTLAPDVFPRFVSAVGAGQPFDFHLIDANQPLAGAPPAYTLGRSAQGRPVQLYELGNGPRVALFLATIHGDEAAGTDLLWRLKRHFEARPEELGEWQLRLIPRLNVDSNRRTNARGVDLNRNFPALWTPSPRDEEYSGPAPLSEPEARCLQMAVLGTSPGPVGRPERIISIHQHGGIGPGQGLLDGDGPPGPAAALVETMRASRPRQLAAHKIADSQGRLRIPGSFGTWVSTPAVNIPTVTFEISQQDDDAEQNWQNYRQVLLDFLR